ncbi:MAG: spore cortex biosynthesis protein YabQ [Ruminococcus sp.]|nr:spore cortex biosynthesis protein YabQ [Ruminococcus sp.]MCM1381392.1 spore cortex biosynthesis protein YabQ [Muribaculaceae bacterium]MCM1479514.1 spore cortex biosynthesis protein YabQ [Muribaculaceae bacterium]
MSLNTFFSVSQQTAAFLMSVLLGAGLGVVYDCFRAARILLPALAKPKPVFVQDVVFWLIYGFCVFCFAAVSARGQVRLFMFLGSVLGFTLYILTLGNFITGIIRRAAEAVYGILHKVYSAVIEPIVKIMTIFCQKVSRFFVRSHKNNGKSERSVKKLLKNKGKLVYNKKAKYIRLRNVFGKSVNKKRNIKEQKENPTIFG